MREEGSVRTWSAEVPPEPEDVTCVRDESGHGDLWRKIDAHWYIVKPDGSLGIGSSTWDDILTEFGPLVEVIES
jgi:hypothetical protein